MTEKTWFQEAVGQAVIGNVNEAPRFNNYLHVVVGNEKIESERISDYQRARIYGKVKELIAATGAEDTNSEILSIYRMILDQFDISAIEQLPAKRYKAVQAALSRWIEEATNQAQLVTSEIVEKKVVPMPPAPIAVDVSPCLSCLEKDASLARLERTSQWQWGALSLTVALCGWLLYKTPPAVNAPDAVPRETTCQNDGKSYSAGSTSKILNVGIRECIIDGQGPRWGDVQKNRGR